MARLRLLYRMLRASPLLLTGTIIVSSFAAIALLAPVLAPPTSSDPYLCPYEGPPTTGPIFYHPPPTLPSSEHPFGTLLGYDLYYGCIWGVRIAFYVSILVTVLSLAVGLCIGSVAGYLEGIVDEVLMRFTDAFFALPGILFVLLIVTALPLRLELNLGLFNLTLAMSSLDRIILGLAIVGWPQYARVIRGEIKKVKQQDFVEAAKAVGCSRLRTLTKHILPNSINPVLSLMFLNMGGVLIAASTISFLGFGPGEGYAEWGSIIAGARSWLIFMPETSQFVWLFLMPGVFLSAFVLGWSLLGDALMYVIDPAYGRRLNVWG